MGKHPSYCCQRCGENVGYLGKIVEFIYYRIFRIKMFKHTCRIKRRVRISNEIDITLRRLEETLRELNNGAGVTLDELNIGVNHFRYPPMFDVYGDNSKPEELIKKNNIKHKFIKNE